MIEIWSFDPLSMPLSFKIIFFSQSVAKVDSKIGGRPSKSVYGLGTSWTQSKKNNDSRNGYPLCLMGHILREHLRTGTIGSCFLSSMFWNLWFVGNITSGLCHLLESCLKAKAIISAQAHPMKKIRRAWSVYLDKPTNLAFSMNPYKKAIFHSVLMNASAYTATDCSAGVIRW